MVRRSSGPVVTWCDPDPDGPLSTLLRRLISGGKKHLIRGVRSGNLPSLGLLEVQGVEWYWHLVVRLRPTGSNPPHPPHCRNMAGQNVSLCGGSERLVPLFLLRYCTKRQVLCFSLLCVLVLFVLWCVCWYCLCCGVCVGIVWAVVCVGGVCW